MQSKLAAIFLSVLSVGLMVSAAPAIATTYTSSTGKTAVVLNEGRTGNDNFYFTEVNGRSILGDITITSAQSNGNSYRYEGTFREQTLGPRAGDACTGTITIVRQPIPRSANHSAQVTWRVTGGRPCASIGQTFSLNLTEPLPRPDRNGNYTDRLANTWMSQTSGLATWPKWRVTSSDGELNCRVQPNGPIKTVYRAGRDEISAELRGTNAITMSNGAPWMLTTQGCYVRANSQYIAPIALPR